MCVISFFIALLQNLNSLAMNLQLQTFVHFQMFNCFISFLCVLTFMVSFQVHSKV